VGDLADDAAVAAGGDVAAGPGIDLGHLAGGEELLLLDDDGAAAVAALSVLPDAALDVVTLSTMLAGPSLLIWPCGRWAALQAMGSFVSISRLNQ